MKQVKHLYSYSDFIFEEKISNNASHNKLAVYGLSLLSQIRTWHWEVTVGDFHKALGDFYDAFSDINDKLIEAVMGKYGRIRVAGQKQRELVDYSAEEFNSFIEEMENTYSKEYKKTFTNDPEICNIIDEILGEIQKIKYLSTMS